MDPNVVLATQHGCLVRNPKNPLYLDMIIIRGAHDMYSVLDALHDAVADVIEDFQMILNYGNFAKYYRSAVQVKLARVEDVDKFKEPRAFVEGDDNFEIILNDS
jgi:hypothetical protein